MCNYADESGICYPSVAALGRDTAQDRKTVISNIHSLVAGGYLKDTGDRIGQTRGVIVYQIQGAAETSNPKNGTGTENGTVPKFPGSSTVFPGKRSQKRDTDPSGNHQGTVKPTAEVVELHESLPRESWEDWLTHRRERRWSMSPRALKPQLKLLAKFDTDTQREIIETSMQAGWQGLFALKGKPRPNGGAGWM
jgi:Helix-turn-helix domain